MLKDIRRLKDDCLHRGSLLFLKTEVRYVTDYD